jgi:ribosomal protein L12E/L44/L45/RPP1/RPP2
LIDGEDPRVHQQEADAGPDEDRRCISSEDAQIKELHGALEDRELDEVAYHRNEQVLPDLAAPSRAAIAKGPEFRESKVRGQS